MQNLDLATLERLGKAMTRLAEVTRERDHVMAEVMAIWPDFPGMAERPAPPVEPPPVAAAPAQPKPVPASHVAIAMLRKYGALLPAEIVNLALKEFPNLEELTVVSAVRPAVFRQKHWFDRQDDGRYALMAGAPGDDELIAPFGGAKP